ncbi:spore coat putative kinase YutH [Bacillus sp. 03113]|uniref:spore coat putative kinase YutH n=1 Tax=Bacillus sp. 03113 TaxID=2578211 RepID=UPI0011449C1F|nr:spore coat protein YutH [Bacillus sp. 03113]
MLQTLLSKQFEIQADEEIIIGRYEACKRNNQLYMLVPIHQYEEDDLNELERFATHLVQKGDRDIVQFLHTKDGKRETEWEKRKYCILFNNQIRNQEKDRSGRMLGKFHHRGRSINFTVTRSSRVGQWKQLWEKRLDQMEKVWSTMIYQQPENEFDRMFIESFSYYLGLAENSIQYLIDTEIDDDPLPMDSGTICHNRFSSSAWGESFIIKNPFDWVFDHSSRDLAEWIRDRYFQNMQTYHRDMAKLLTDYQTITPLSSFSWRLLYARMVFPLHYFENIENYYSTSSEQQKNYLEDKLEKYLHQSSEYERFLRDFFQHAEVPIRKMKIPELEWLKRS